MFLEYRKELRVIFNNIGALVSCSRLCWYFGESYVFTRDST